MSTGLVAPCPAQGTWENPLSWFPQAQTEYEHAVFIGKPGPHQGKIFIIRAHVRDGLFLWDPASPLAVEPYPNDDLPTFNNFSCCGQSWDRDGDLVISGGDQNVPFPLPTQPEPWCYQEPLWTYVYKPDTWDIGAGQLMLTPPSPPARYGYYYPTTLCLQTGDIGSFGGSSAPWRSVCTTPPGGTPPQGQRANNWQVFNKSAMRWEGQSPGPNDVPLPGVPTSPDIWGFNVYPRVTLQSTGDVFVSAAMYGGWDPAPPPGRYHSFSAYRNVASWPSVPTSWVIHPSKLQNPMGQTVNLKYCCSIQWPYRVGATGLGPWDNGGWFDRVLVLGGYDDQLVTLNPTAHPSGHQLRAAERSVWQITNPLASSWIIPPSYGSLLHPRVYANAVITPDLKLIVFGGCTHDYVPATVAPIPVYQPEMLDLLNPSTGWQPLSPHQSARLYHSVALLLKDGRIFVGSGTRNTVSPPTFNHSDAEVFVPPCYEQGLPRPAIIEAPTEIHYGQDIPVIKVAMEEASTPANEIEFATLIRCGAVTHHFDADQRCVVLEVRNRDGNEITLHRLPSQAQGGHFVAPPGYYFLFLVTTERGNPLVRVPSVARIVRIS